MINLDIHYLPHKVWIHDIKIEDTRRVATGSITEDAALKLFKKVFSAPRYSYKVFEVEPTRVVIGHVDTSPDLDMIASLQYVTPGILARRTDISGSLLCYILSPQDEGVMHGAGNHMFIHLRMQSQRMKLRYNMPSLSVKAKEILYGEKA